MRRSLFVALVAVASASASACDSSAPPADPPGMIIAPVQGDANDPFPITAPATAPTRSLAANASHHYRLTVPPTHDGLRVALSCTQTCSVYLRRTTPTSSVLTSSTSATLHTLFRTNAEVTAADDLWYIEVRSAAAALDYTLRVDDRYARPLAWDNGAAAVGTTLASAPDTVGGDYLYTTTTQLGAYGAWRTVLLADQGDAAIYLGQGTTVPSTSSSYRSEKVGSDAVVLAQYEFAANQTWTLRVRAQPGANWRLFTGDLYVKDLGTLKADASSSATLTIGPEGAAWAKTTVPGTALAWRLWSPTGTTLYVNDTAAPVPGKTSTYDLTRASQLLVVPDYLTSSQYIVAVEGPAGAAYLDSRLQTARTPSAEPGHTGNDFSFVLDSGDDQGFGYVTWRVDVPVDQIAWQVTAEPTLGDVDVYVRRGKVPAEYDNSGMSEVVGPVADSVVQVPPTLTDGPWYITVHGAPPFTLQLSSGNPEITDIPYVNDPNLVPNGLAHEDQAGWRYYRVRDIDQQTGTLGWILELQNQVAGTEIAVRRNGVPGRWYYRQNRQTYISTGEHIDASGTQGFLERPNHPPDVWYVGILQKDQALGPFQLRTRQVLPDNLDLNAGDIAITAQPSGRWRWFKTSVPPSALGWDLALTNITSGQPRIVFRQDLIPGDFQTNPYYAYTATSWQSGYQWAPQSDLTARPYAPYVQGQNVPQEVGRHVQMGLGSPINEGIYYVGVSDLYTTPTGTPLTYHIKSRGIGQGNAPSGSPWSIQVQDLAFSGGSATVDNLPAREAAWFKVPIPAGQESFAAALDVTSGEAMMALHYGALPNSETSPNSYTSDYTGGSAVRRQKNGGEFFYKYPTSNQTTIPAGSMYIAVGAEGQSPYSSSYIGTGTSSFTLRSIGNLPVAGGANVDLGLADPLVFPSQALKYGEQRAYRFNVPAGVSSMELRLKNVTGRPYLQLAKSPVVFPTVSETYRASEGGSTQVGYGDASQTVTITAPAGVYTAIVSTYYTPQGADLDAAYDLEITARGEGVIDFNGGTAAVTAQAPQTWRFWKVVVPPEATGWDVRIVNVQAGSPRLAIRRDILPDSLSTTCCSLFNRTQWNTGEYWAPNYDLTQRPYAPYVQSQTTSEIGRVVTMGMGSPLSPGTYYIGVIDSTSSATGTAMTYELVSRGIGQGNAPTGEPWAIPITDIALEQTVSVANVPARDVTYYKMDIPANTPSFEMELEPTSGEAMFAIARGALPNSESTYSYNTADTPGGVRRQQNGTEFFYAYPPSSQTAIVAGTYYIAVASEGQSPYSTSYIGTGASSFTLRTKGLVDVQTAAQPLGTAAPTSWTGQTLRYGEQKSYRLTVPAGTTSMEVKLANVTGRPYVTLVKDPSPFPTPTQSYIASQGGWGSTQSTDSIVTIAQPAGTWTATVVGYYSPQGQPVAANYDLVMTALSDEVVAFNGGEAQVTAQPTRTWRYFRVTVPSDAQGWDLRLVNVTGGLPKMVVRRDILPDSFSTTCCGFTSRREWKTGEQWYPSSDITARPYTPYVQGQNPVNEGNGRVLVAGMGAPLSPGNYVIGVIDDLNTSGAAMSYTLRSRGIGKGDDSSGTPWAVQVVDVPWQGGEMLFQNIAPREAVYVHVNVPAAVEALGFELETIDGEAMMSVKKGAIPNSEPSTTADGETATDGQPVRRQKAGDEFHYHYVRYNETAITPGDWYFALTSEGKDPYSTSYIGTGTSSFRFKSPGRLIPEGGIDRVVAPGTGVSFDDQSLRYGEQRIYRFRVTADVPAYEVRLANRVGGPSFSLQLKPFFQTTVPTPATQSYRAAVGGQSYLFYDDLATTVVGQSGDVTVVVTANRDAQSQEADAQFDLVVTPRVVDPLTWRGGTADISLATKETRFFRLDVPNDCDGVPLAGWLVTAENTTGTYTIRARKDSLPGDPVGSTTFQANANQVVVAPPYFGPGRWYVSVEGTNLSTLTLRSEEISELQHWDMPLRGVTPSSPGVPPPYFADSGVGPDGTPLNAGDRGRDLGQGRHHFYRVTIPPGNGGLLATYLEALSGNPDLYIRRGAAPTRNHAEAGYGGTIYDYSDTQPNTTYGHLVPVTARKGWELEPGEWWIAVYAPSSNVRYRLKLSVGDIQDLAFSGGSVAGASLAAGDMRHYRVTVPQSSTTLAQSVPTTWNLHLLQQSGDAVVFLREIVPSGQTNQNLAASQVGTAYYWADWVDDRNEVWGTNSLLSPVLDNSGTTTLSVPALMPGTEYIISVYAKTQVVYDLDATPGSTMLALDGILPFKGGTVDVTLAPGEKRLYRVDVPADAARWVQDATLGQSVWVYLQLGTVPPASGSADRTNSGQPTGADWDLPLYSSSTSQQYNYPWMPGRSYYLMAENKNTTPQQFKVVLDGRDKTNDSDSDGLPDWWEYDNFSGLSYNGTYDYDSDDLTNAAEYARGTSPITADSDADGLWDGLEVALGSDPLDSNSDTDLACDGDDSAPTDPTDSGEVIRLTLHHYTDGQFGNGFGTNHHLKTLRAVFTKTASVKAHWIHARAWGIDQPGEVGVYLNGVSIGTLPVGSANGYSQPIMFWVDTADLKTGDNFVELRRSGGGDSWGVEDLGLFTFGDPFGNDSTRAYDTRHPDGVTLVWPKPTAGLFELRGFDIDGAAEVTGQLDGKRWFELPQGGDLAWTRYYQMPFGASDFTAGAHTIDLKRNGGDGDWQIRIVDLRTPVTQTFGTYSSSENSHGASGVGYLFPVKPADRELKLRYQAWPAGSTVDLAGTNVYAYPSLLPESQSYTTQEILLCSRAADVDQTLFSFHAGDTTTTSATWNAQMTYWGVPLDSDSDTYDDCVDRFPRDKDEWYDDDGDRLGDNWEKKYFGDIAVSDGTTDTDGDGLIDSAEFVGRTDPVCADNDHDGFVALTDLCASGTDCDDQDPTSGANTTDHDCDGVPTTTDCDDNDPSVTHTNVGDADCDGVPTASDCDDHDPAIATTNAGDADCDGVPTASDCDDSDPSVTHTNVGDADCDGVPTASDCDDHDPA
ncbi:MAG: thrombospondin type 3 repeat-containing protein, partial [Myxococcota bacterium]